jgi:hypothetical protein
LPRFFTPVATPAAANPSGKVTLRCACRAKPGSSTKRVIGSIRAAPRSRQAQHHVHVLHGLSRSALHQVVDGADDDDLAGALVDGHVDAAVVGAGDVLELRRRVADVHEGLAGVELAVAAPQELSGAWAAAGPEAHVHRLGDAALQRDQVRHEGQGRAGGIGRSGAEGAAGAALSPASPPAISG